MDTTISYQKNSFDIIRYYAAFAVMLLHFTGYFAILSTKQSSFLAISRAAVLFYPGVIVLFSLSGFLIASSFERTNNRKIFIKKRIFRLFPELWICTLCNLLVLSLLTAKSFDKSIILWLFTQIFGIANTPSCLQNFATGSVNGALWTIFVELQLYIIIMLFYPLIKKLSLTGWCILLSLSTGINLALSYFCPLLPSALQKIIERTFFPYALWFFIGMLCYTKRAMLLPFLKKSCLYLLALYIILYVLIHKQPGYYCGIITSILCPFITIGLSYRLPAFRIKIDLSYGIFLYHWIVLNILVHFNLIKRLPWPVTLVLFVVSTLILSWSSHSLNKYIFKTRKKPVNSKE